MSKYLHSLVCGIDVAADFSYAAILNPDGSLYRKPFRVDHDAESLKKFASEIQKVEKLCSMKCHLFMEFTGIYHMPLSHFLHSMRFEVFNAPEEDVISLVGSLSRKGIKWAKNTYHRLIQATNNAMVIGLNHCSSNTVIKSHLNIIREFDRNIEAIKAEMEELTESENFPLQARKNLKLLSSISGMGFLSAVTILSEIGNFEEFPKPKHLVAFFGVDPAVNQSGKFKGDKVKMSKRGTRFGRRALYAVALACVRRKRNGLPNNPILLEYYSMKCESKKKKVALGAVMHKLLKYIFAVLRDQKPYQEKNSNFSSLSTTHIILKLSHCSCFSMV